MAETTDPRVVAAEVGRTGLYAAVRQAAGMNRMEAQYQRSLGDLQAKAQIEGMGKDVVHLPEEERLAETLSRFALIVCMMMGDPKSQQLFFWHLYVHLRAAGLLDAVKPDIGLVVDSTGRRVPPRKVT